MPFPCAAPARMRPTSSITLGKSSADSSISILPASIFEKSKMSLMMTSRLSAETFTPGGELGLLFVEVGLREGARSAR